MMTRLVTFAALALLTLLSACSAVVDPAICTLEFRFGIGVQVQDSLTGAWIGSGATLVARDGSYVDSVTAQTGRPDMDDAPLVTAGERAGTYDLVVRREGYQPWSKTGVKVERDECHVHSVMLLARMRPL
jgi:hypothetical protein